MSQAELLSPASLSPSVSLHAGRPATTSLEVAKFFGKRHDHVLRDIDALLSQLPENSLQPNFGETYQEQETPLGVKQVRVFILYRDGFMLLVMGYTGKKALGVKLAYIEAFNRMEAELARQKESAIPAAPSPDASLTLSTTEDRKPLRALVGSWAQVSGLPFAACWNQLKAAFQLANIKELPQAWLPDALAWVQEKIDALPAPLPEAPVPAAAPAAYTPPVDMSSGRADALRRIESAIRTISGAQEVVRLFCHPGPKTMRMSPQERAMYDAEHQLYANAIDTLYAVRCTLEAGHALERLRSPQPGRSLPAGRM